MTLSLGNIKLSGRVARQLLVSPDTVAAVAYLAAEAVLGDEMELADMDPEALRIILEDLHGLSVPPDLYDRIYAVSCLRDHPEWLLDSAPAFENAVLALCGEPVSAGIMQDPSIPCLCWGTRHAADIVRQAHPSARDLDDEGLWGREVRQYVAAELFESGYALCPDELAFAQATLDIDTGNPADLKRKVRARWCRLDKARLKGELIGDSAVDVQVGRLAACYLYCQEQEQLLLRQLSSALRGASLTAQSPRT